MSLFREFTRWVSGGGLAPIVLNAAQIISVERAEGTGDFAYVVMTDREKFFISDYEAVRDWLLGLAHD